MRDVAVRQTVVLLVNPSSGGGRGRGVAEGARRQLEHRGLDVELIVTADGDDLEKRARDAAASRAAVVAIAGGDGSVQRVADALADSSTTLALLPCGRGNDLARALNVPFDPAAAADVIADGHSRSIDLGRVGETRFATVAALGFDAHIAGIVHRREVPGRGALSYGLALVKGMASYQPFAASVRCEAGEVSGEFFLIAAANTRSYGSGLRIAPDARPDDGVFDVVLVNTMSRLTLLGLLPQLLTGTHVAHPSVFVMRTRELTIESEAPLAMYADGEPFGHTPLTLSVAPRALRILIPEGGVARSLVQAAIPA